MASGSAEEESSVGDWRCEETSEMAVDRGFGARVGEGGGDDEAFFL